LREATELALSWFGTEGWKVSSLEAYEALKKALRKP